ncbi:MAG: glutamate racemase [Patescibacteria group bacterium]|nr:glutamate racemase [Patescibacteria group bacterium]
MNYIGIFDSGVGGLGIFNEILFIFPCENILYFADSKNCPYGEKPLKKIKEICRKNTKFLIDKGAKIIVVACNSASVSALNYLRSEFAGVPIIGVVPVVKTAAKITKNKRIGILATKATINSDYLKGLVREFCNGDKVYYVAAGELVDIVENFQFPISNFQSNPKSQMSNDKKLIANSKIIKNSLLPFIKAKVDVVALGCTHFPFLRAEIEEILGPKVQVLDSNAAVARQVNRILTNNRQLSVDSYPPVGEAGHLSVQYKFYTSGNARKSKIQIENLTGLRINKVEKISF